MAIDLEAGSSQYILTADAASIDNITGAWSVVTWVKIESLPASGDLMDLFGRWKTVNDGGFALDWYNNSGTQEIGITTLNTVQTGGSRTAYTTATGSWICVVGIHDTADDFIYINNVQVHTVSNVINQTANDIGLAVGGFNLNGVVARFFDGETEDFRLFARVLTAEERSLLGAGYRGPLGGEVIWLSMCEARTLATPGTLTQGTHLLPDLSVNSNDGDPYGDVVLVASDCPRMGMVV